MAVGVNVDWKIPIGYFLVNGLSSEEKAGIVKQSLFLLHDVGVRVVGLTFDGLQSNFAMASLLGANLNVHNMKPFFPHPITGQNVYVILDPCHMLKLTRNMFATVVKLLDMNDNEINWKYIVELEKLQNQEGLTLANKLRRNHVYFQKQKMEVKLAVQILSSSVSTSLGYLSNELKMKGFNNCKPTADFCDIFDKLFDIGNLSLIHI